MTEPYEESREWDESAAGAAFLDEAQAVFTGVVQEVGPDPQYASGMEAAFQRLTLTVTAVERGDLYANDSVDLDILVVAGSPYVSPNEAAIPALDRNLCSVGASLRAYAVWEDGRWRLAYSDRALAAAAAAVA